MKNDCVFGDDLDIEEISYVSEVLEFITPLLHRTSIYICYGFYEDVLDSL